MKKGKYRLDSPQVIKFSLIKKMIDLLLHNVQRSLLQLYTVQ